MRKTGAELTFWIALIVAVVTIIFGSVYLAIQDKKQDFDERTVDVQQIL